MIRKIGVLMSRRERIAARIRLRQRELREGSSRLHDRVDAYLGTPHSLLQGFLAGFMLDQARPMVPNGPMPLKFLWPNGLLPLKILWPSLLRWLT